MARTISVADCEPVLPPLSMSSGMKNARASAVSSVSSKASMTLLETSSTADERQQPGDALAEQG
jgi:hypothetical protein